jgi:hypothetical protein
MSTKWEPIPAEKAKQHSLYGVRGWLAFFCFGILFGPFTDILQVNELAHRGGHSLGQLLAFSDPIIVSLRWIFGLKIVLAAVICWMMIGKTPLFRVATTCLLAATVPALMLSVVLITGDPGGHLFFPQIFVINPACCVIWCIYFHLSQRVRVTFEHSVRKESAAYEAPATSPSPFASPFQSPSPGNSILPEVKAQAPEGTGIAAENGTVSMSSIDQSVEEQQWATALAEFEGPNRRPGLWAKSFTNAQGNEVQAKVHYLNARMAELTEAHRKLRAEQEQQRSIALEEQRLAGVAGAQRTYELAPKGICPNCDGVLLLDSKVCPLCKATFYPGGWAITPIPQTEALAALYKAEIEKA